MDARRRLLIRKLVLHGIPLADASMWKIKPSSCDKSKYEYNHENIERTLYSLKSAKEAHILYESRKTSTKKKTRKVARKKPVVVPKKVPDAPPAEQQHHQKINRGTPEALKAIGEAWWEHATGTSPAISEKLAKELDVVVVVNSDFWKSKTKPPVSAWSLDGLVLLGFQKVTRSSLIIDSTGRILSLFVNEKNVKILKKATRDFDVIHERLERVMIPNVQRPGIWMFGYRFNKNQDCRTKTPHKIMRTGYYQVRTLRNAVELNGDETFKRQLVDMASRMCEAERYCAPAMADHRMKHAIESGHPGIIPGVCIADCPAQASGISKGFVSKVHTDAGFSKGGGAETIVWEAIKNKEGGQCFAIVDAGVVFEFGDSKQVMIMVPGKLRHGTPRCRRGFTSGIGAVIVNKKNLLSDEAKRDSEIIRWKLEHGQASSNPFVSGFATNDAYDYPCKNCHSTKGEILLCDTCNQGSHLACEKQPMEVDGSWNCSKCSAVLRDRI